MVDRVSLGRREPMGVSEATPDSLVRGYRIEETVSVLKDYPAASNAQMIGLLENLGYDRPTSVNLVAFVPMAFFRVVMERGSVLFPKTCIFYNQDDEEWEVTVDEQQVYLDAREYARLHFPSMSSQDILTILQRSCEYIQVNTLLDQGVAPENVVAEVAEFAVDGQEAQALAPSTEDDSNAQPWWAFWK